MKTFFKELFGYTFNFNDKVINSLKNSNAAMPEKAVKLLNHTINAHEVWNARILGETCTTGIWEVHPYESLADINKANYNKSLTILDNYGLDTVINYTNSKGDSFQNTLQDILFHIVNHSTYHRGQIATDSKENGITPLVTDYIFYKRE
ncbi:DinB family protein [Flavobacterium sp. MK4S-17]|uniref:DinB family protein n=1 Tax=Flavobacterium sp. MK4S-17 TaxID=2543737 RepID=UPI001358B0F7|nr:DinB family protein [Flavobacterium sp. MK4S-17]